MKGTTRQEQCTEETKLQGGLSFRLNTQKRGPEKLAGGRPLTLEARRPMNMAKSSSSREVAILRSVSTTMPTFTNIIMPETKSMRLSRARCAADVRTFSSGSSCSRPSRGVSLKLFSTRCPPLVRAASTTRLKYLLRDEDPGAGGGVRTAPCGPGTLSLALESHAHWRGY